MRVKFEINLFGRTIPIIVDILDDEILEWLEIKDMNELDISDR